MCLFKKKTLVFLQCVFVTFFWAFALALANVKNNMCESYLLFKDYDFKINACESSNVYRDCMILRFIMQLRMINFIVFITENTTQIKLKIIDLTVVD